jgi:alpha,alpha-trehalose phosphorylase
MTTLSYDAVLFDLDGVLTSTAALHALCWKRTFDDVLSAYGQEPFDIEHDYVEYVDGKMRADGVRDFLAARRIHVTPDMVRVIADRKQAMVEQALIRGGVEAFEGSVRWVRHLRGTGVRTAVVSSSANADAVLYAAGISDLFELTVDGSDISRLGFAGKPAPDGFLVAARRLGVAPRAGGRGRGRAGRRRRRAGGRVRARDRRGPHGRSSRPALGGRRRRGR